MSGCLILSRAHTSSTRDGRKSDVGASSLRCRYLTRTNKQDATLAEREHGPGQPAKPTKTRVWVELLGEC